MRLQYTNCFSNICKFRTLNWFWRFTICFMLWLMTALESIIVAQATWVASLTLFLVKIPDLKYASTGEIICFFCNSVGWIIKKLSSKFIEFVSYQVGAAMFYSFMYVWFYKLRVNKRLNVRPIHVNIAGLLGILVVPPLFYVPEMILNATLGNLINALRKPKNKES